MKESVCSIISNHSPIKKILSTFPLQSVGPHNGKAKKKRATDDQKNEIVHLNKSSIFAKYNITYQCANYISICVGQP